MNKRYKVFGVLLLLLIPLFFINIRNSHDWGDDFPDDAVFVFFRARIIALYTDRKATYSWYSTSEHETVEQLDERFKSSKVNYMLINKDLEDEGTELYMNKYPDKLQLIWQNAKFKLFSLKN